MPAARKICFVVAAVTAAAMLAFRVGGGVDTDLYALADSTNGGVLKEIAAGLAGQGRVVVEGSAEHPPMALADAVAGELACRQTVSFADTLAFLSRHKEGLLAPDVRERLKAGKFSEVAEDSMAQLFGFAHPLFSVKDDPFLLATGYAMSLQSRMGGGWTIKDGYPYCERDGRAFLLVSADLSKIAPERLASFLERAKAFNEGGADFGQPAATQSVESPKLWCGGPPFHAARTAENAKREINLLSTVSIAVVLAVGWFLIRSFRFVPALLVALGIAALFAGAVLFAVFPRPHVLTFVFGTSLIGLSVDYVYHSCAAGGARNVKRQLFCAMLTTAAAFAPLLVSSVDVLRQMALFTMAGLVAVWAWVVVFLRTARTVEKRPSVPVRPSRLGRIAALLALLLSLLGIVRVKFVCDPAAFYRPDSYLAASEKRLAELDPGGTGKFVYVRGDTLQEALMREEAAGIKGLSAVIPSLQRQRENRSLVAKLYEREGAALTAKTGLPVPKMAANGDEGLLDPERVDDVRLQGLIRAAWTGKGLVSPCPKGFSPKDKPNNGDCPRQEKDILVLEPKRALTDMFERFTATTLQLLGVSLAVLSILLAILFRRRFFRLVLPVVSALAATIGILGWLGIPITFFTLLCIFVLTGLGIDYAIFQAHGDSPLQTDGDSPLQNPAMVSRTVFCSFLTSFVGLGALSFTDFPVTRSMGITFAFGLFFSYIFAKFSVYGIFAKVNGDSPLQDSGDSPRQNGGKYNGDSPQDGVWHVQSEQSAGVLRIWFLWIVYRWFGKGVQKLLCIPVMIFIYPFACPAKEALREFYSVLESFKGIKGEKGVKGIKGVIKDEYRLFRHLLGFAWSMADKTDACTLKKNLPRMTVRDDAGWREFDALTRAKKGAFLISTHLGTIEVLPALPIALTRQDAQPHMHAFQQMGHDAKFMKVFMRHFDATHLTLHAVEDIGVETAVAMQEAIGRGELVLMAGDRVSAGSGKTLRHGFLGRECSWPKGVFTFARLMQAPVFFVTCLRTGWNAYEVHVEKMKNVECRMKNDEGAVRKVDESLLLDEYVRFLEKETLDYPDQWYQFYSFFGG